MKRVFLILLAVAFSGSLKAQLTSADVPQAGDSYNYYVDTVVSAADVNVGNSGNGQTWTFAFDKDSTIVYNYLDPANTPYSADFPNATIALQYNNWNAYGYARIDNNGVYDIGFAGNFISSIPFSTPPTKFMPDELQRMKFPANVTTTFSDTGFIRLGATNIPYGQLTLDSIEIHSHIYRTVEVDATGTLDLNNSSFSNVYRFKVTEYRNDSAWVWVSIISNMLALVTHDTTISYVWYDPNYRNERLSIDFSRGETGSRSNPLQPLAFTPYADTIVTFSDDVVTSLALTNAKPLNIYPNPTRGEIFVNSINIHNVKVNSLLGQEIKVPYTSKSIDISHLPEGIYIITVTDINGEIYRTKVIKE